MHWTRLAGECTDEISAQVQCRHLHGSTRQTNSQLDASSPFIRNMHLAGHVCVASSRQDVIRTHASSKVFKIQIGARDWEIENCQKCLECQLIRMTLLFFKLSERVLLGVVKKSAEKRMIK